MDGRLKNILSNFDHEYQPLNFTPKKLQKVYEAVRSKYEEGDLLPPIDVSLIIKKIDREVLQRGNEVDNVLSEREQRLVPYLAFQGDPPFIMNDKFCKFCREQIKGKDKSSLISTWLHNLLKNKRTDSNNVKHLIDLFEEQLNQYKGGSRRVKTWKDNSALLLSSEKKAANHILNQGKSINGFLVENKLSSELNESDYTNTIVEYMISKCARNNLRYLNQVLSELKYTTSDGTIYYRKNELIRYAASKIIKVAGTSCEDDLKEKIKKPILAILKDPRVATNKINWEGVDPEAIDVMKQWLSARDIEFFFEIVSKTEDRFNHDSNWEYRKAFWLSYLPFIEDTWLLLGSKAKRVADLISNNNNWYDLNYGKVGGLGGKQCVFFMRIKDVEIVEYSLVGASRVWKQADSPLKFRSHSMHVNQFRRNAPPEILWFSHQGSERYNWQGKVSSWLSRNLGIEQKQSFRL